jgi:hypothetical protein
MVAILEMKNAEQVVAHQPAISSSIHFPISFSTAPVGAHLTFAKKQTTNFASMPGAETKTTNKERKHDSTEITR